MSENANGIVPPPQKALQSVFRAIKAASSVLTGITALLAGLAADAVSAGGSDLPADGAEVESAEEDGAKERIFCECVCEWSTSA